MTFSSSPTPGPTLSHTRRHVTPTSGFSSAVDVSLGRDSVVLPPSASGVSEPIAVDLQYQVGALEARYPERSDGGRKRRGERPRQPFRERRPDDLIYFSLQAKLWRKKKKHGPCRRRGDDLLFLLAVVVTWSLLVLSLSYKSGAKGHMG